MAVYLDYLSFTYIGASGPFGFDQFRTVFPEFEDLYTDSYFLEQKGYKYANYQRVLCLNDFIRIHFDNEESLHRGVNVSVSSQGLPLLLDLLKPEKYYLGKFDGDITAQLLQLLEDRECVVKRIDVYMDDESKRFMPIDYGNWMINDQIRTRFRRFEVLSDGHKGVTFYLGDRSNGKYLRIYDKEKESKGSICAVRYEIELRKSYAIKFSQEYRNNPGINFVELLTGSFFEVIDNSTCKSNKSMCPVLPEWQSFINLSLAKNQENNKVNISVCRKFEPGKRWRWFVEICAPTLYYARKAFGATLFDSVIESRMHSREITDRDKNLMSMIYKYKGMFKDSISFTSHGEKVPWEF